MAKFISGKAAVYPIIPTVEVQHESEIPSADVLSRLNIFDIWREETRTREIANRLSSDQMRDAQEARRQQALGSSPTKNDGGSVTQIAIRETIEENGAGQEDPEQEEHGTVI